MAYTPDEVIDKANAAIDKALKTPARNAGVPTSAPRYITKHNEGQDGFYLSRFAKSAFGATSDNHGTLERDLLTKFTRAAINKGHKLSHPNSYLLPIDPSAIDADMKATDEYQALSQAMAAGQGRVDPDELSWEARKFIKAGSGTLSAYQGGQGGDFVAPPTLVGVIDIIRNKEVFFQAGAEQFPLPPQGSVVYGRQTDVTLATWQGESMAAPSTNIATGGLTLTAKKLTALAKMSNESERFSAGLASQTLQNDLGTTVALKLDEAIGYGTGGTNVPQGLITANSGIYYYVGAAGAQSNGNTWKVEDAASMASIIEAQNFELKAWVMHPFMRRLIQNLRADAVSAGDGAGMFMYDLVRAYESTGPVKLQNAPVYTSNQIKRNYTKGTGTGLTTVLGGDFSNVVVGMYGALELTANPWDSTAFAQNETLFRVLMFADSGIKRTGAFVAYHNLICPAGSGSQDTPSFTTA